MGRGELVPGPSMGPVSRVHFVLAWGLCVAGLLITLVSWLPGPGKVPTTAAVAVFAAAIPVFGAALLRSIFSERARTLLRRDGGGMGRSIGVRPLLAFLRTLPTGLRCAYVLVLVVFALAMLTGGAAEDARADGNGRYYHTHWKRPEQRTERVWLTEAEYHEATRARTRVFASAAMLFHGVAGFLVLVAAPAAPPSVARREETARP